MVKNTFVKILLSPIALLYSSIIGLRNKLFDVNILSSKSFKMPVIGIGNITVGGTGKTPHTEYLIKLLNEDNKLAVLSRGYKRKTSGYLEADQNSTSLTLGDEPMQMHRKFGKDVKIVVSEDRVKGITNIRKKYEDIDVVLLDDVYQHRHVKPGLNILLIDYNRPLFEDSYMPIGSLRESKYNYDRANIVVVTKCPNDIKPIDRRVFLKRLNLYPYQRAYFTNFKYGNLVSVEKGTELELESIRDFEIILVTGISRPVHLLNYLQKKLTKIEHFEYPDHYSFKKKDIEAIKRKFNEINNSNKLILTTEKDAVRLLDIDGFKDLIPNLYQLPIEVDFLDNESENFNKQILNYVKEDKRNH